MIWTVAKIHLGGTVELRRFSFVSVLGDGSSTVPEIHEGPSKRYVL
jgi:hypothetical protein